MLHINVEAASCGIWQPLKWRGLFFIEQSRDDRWGKGAAPSLSFQKPSGTTYSGHDKM